MDHPLNSVEEVAESVNPGDEGSSASKPSESNVTVEPNEVLLRISQDMAWVLERLTAPKAPIDMVRRHGAEEFHGTNMEESDNAEFWLEKLQRILEEVRCPPNQRVSCVVLTEAFQCRQFEYGLHESIKRYLALVTIFH